jgi:predicted small integral membrane protein
VDDEVQPGLDVTQPVTPTVVKKAAPRRAPAKKAAPAPAPLLDDIPVAEPLENDRIEIPRIVPAEPLTQEQPAVPDTELQPVVRTGGRPRVRRVTRVIRHIDTWSVFKVSLVFSFFLYVVLLTAGVLLWQVAQNTGTVDNIERFFETFGWQSFSLKGGEIYHNAWTGGLFLVVGLTGLMVLAATLFNLITDLVGGIRVSVLEEEVVENTAVPSGWRALVSRRSKAG